MIALRVLVVSVVASVALSFLLGALAVWRDRQWQRAQRFLIVVRRFDQEYRRDGFTIARLDRRRASWTHPDGSFAMLEEKS